MLVQTTYTQGTTKEHYDRLLSEGWFRGTGVIYKSDIVCMDEEIFSTVHIRLPLRNFEFKKRHSKLLRNNNSRFRYTIGAPSINKEKEELYTRHFDRFKSFVHNSLSDLINTGLEDITFDTLEISVYDGNKLIALSYVDICASSMASILCVYDQTYARYSLGIYTMLLEIEYGLREGIQYYYPGYVMDRPSCFDYKTSIGKLQWLDIKKGWNGEQHEVCASSKANRIRRELTSIETHLFLAGIQTKKKIYPYFAVGYVLWYHPDLLKYPAYFTFDNDGAEWGISYDIESDKYTVFVTGVAEDFSTNPGMIYSNDYNSGASYELRLMRTIAMWSYDTPAEMIRALVSRDRQPGHEKTTSEICI